MINTSINSTNLRLLFPEVIYLQPEHFSWAKDISTALNSEACRWQTYMNALALAGFEEWLREHLPEQPITRNNNIIESLMFLKVGKFKICLIATENLLEEIVKLPQEVIDSPEFVVHFYVAIEVLEEQQEIIIRGFIRYDLLLAYLHQSNSKIIQDNFYHLPLSVFDAEPNHLLYYCRLLEAVSIPLPVITSVKTEEKLEGYLLETIIKLSRWLEGEFNAGWQAIETLINPYSDFTLSFRNTDKGVKRAKLIDLGIQLGNQNVALLINVVKESEEKLRVLVQLHPMPGQKFLQQNIKLGLLSETGKILTEVSSRNQDNYIQLNAFKGERGKPFTVEVSLANVRVRENFEM